MDEKRLGLIATLQSARSFYAEKRNNITASPMKKKTLDEIIEVTDQLIEFIVKLDTLVSTYNHLEDKE